MTNYERIKNMSVEEIAYLLSKIAYCCATKNSNLCPLSAAESCREDGIKILLESEVEE